MGDIETPIDVTNGAIANDCSVRCHLNFKVFVRINALALSRVKPKVAIANLCTTRCSCLFSFCGDIFLAQCVLVWLRMQPSGASASWPGTSRVATNHFRRCAMSATRAMNANGSHRRADNRPLAVHCLATGRMGLSMGQQWPFAYMIECIGTRQRGNEAPQR